MVMHWTSAVGMALAPIAGMALPHVTAWIRKLDSKLVERFPWLLLRKRRLPYVDADFSVVQPSVLEGQSRRIDPPNARQRDVTGHQGET